jgi:curli biogenesis system outer membrane secretion channel CsgG
MHLLRNVALALSVWPAVAARTVSVACAQGAPAQPAAPPGAVVDSRPTVAVMYFSNGALFRHADYEPLSRGIADMLITGLAANERIRVVERSQIQRLLDEGTFGTSYRVDKETAIRLGRIVGAQHMIFGGFIIEDGDRMRVDARAVNVETSEVEYVESVTDKASKLFELVPMLAARMNRGMHLPPMPPRPPATARPRAQRWYALYLRAVVAEDQRDVAEAIALYKQVLEDFPGYEPALQNLQRLTRTP